MSTATTTAPATTADPKAKKTAVRKSPSGVKAATLKQKAAKKVAAPAVAPEKATAAPAEAKPATPAKAEKPALTQREITALTALKNGKALSRDELRKATGINKGWSKLFGAATKEDFGGNTNGLEPRGLVKHATGEKARTLTYQITAKGLKVLAEATGK